VNRLRSSLAAISCLLSVGAVFHWHAWNARGSWSATVDETCYLRCATNTVALQRLDPQLVAFGIAPLPILVQWLPACTWALKRLQAAIALPSSRQGFALETSHALVGLACGTAISAKYSGVALVAVWGVLWTAVCLRNGPIKNLRQSPRAWLRSDWLAGLAVFLLATSVSCWGWHGFEFAAPHGVLADRSVSGQAWGPSSVLPAPLTAILEQQAHNARGHASMLFGEVSMHGWWYYFPALALMKSTPAELLLLVLSLFAVIACGFRMTRVGLRIVVRRHETPGSESLGIEVGRGVWCTALVVGSVLLFMVRVQIGYRYALPLLILAMMLSVDWLADMASKPTGRTSMASKWMGKKCDRLAIRGLVCLLCVVQLGSSWTNAPHYVSYLSPVLGGGGEAYRYVADSNVDWGQDLPALKQVIAELSIDPSRLALSYFGTANPAAYGIDAEDVEVLSRVSSDRFDFLAVSVNHLYGLSATASPLSQDFQRLRFAPVAARAGHSILIYSVAELLGSENVQTNEWMDVSTARAKP